MIKAKSKVQAKGKPVTAAQAAIIAKLRGKTAAPAAPVKAPAKAPMDAEDMLDGGVDEATEKN
jgi:hypothetical protein